MIYFYKDTTNTTFIVGDRIVPPGLCVLNFYNNDTIVDLRSIDTKIVILQATKITDLLKENDTPYTNKDDLIASLKDFF